MHLINLFNPLLSLQGHFYSLPLQLTKTITPGLTASEMPYVENQEEKSRNQIFLCNPVSMNVAFCGTKYPSIFMFPQKELRLPSKLQQHRVGSAPYLIKVFVNPFKNFVRATIHPSSFQPNLFSYPYSTAVCLCHVSFIKSESRIARSV